MPRYGKRLLQEMDAVDRFESLSAQTHMRYALGCIERIREDGALFWSSDSRQLTRWHKYCNELWGFIADVWKRRDIDKQPLETAMRECFQTFEHFERRIDQMLYKFADDPAQSANCENVYFFMRLVYRLCTYAVVSAWIDDKQDQLVLTANIDLATGGQQSEWTGNSMQVPQKYEPATRKFWLKSTGRPK